MDGTLRNMASIYISKGNKMLLLYRQGGRVVNNVWVGSAGGHFEEYELNDARACVLRELQEELGIAEKEIENLRLRYVTLRRSKGEIRQNYYFFADLKNGVSEEMVSNEGISKWFPLSELTSLEMPFTSKYVIEHYLNTGHKTDMIYVGVADGAKVIFTGMPEF
ncbi:MAG: NUDIX domain-containing protein [Lachnospiraceae bacterium]|nr:NUDIX domain-containing protein [Lachnospiraceae bacterium]MCX4375035.1 NUDIX domain-containing protein [Lachnospiraceae bacterium]